MDLAPSTWTELAVRPPRAVLVPVGSFEQHGPHLPLDTDTRIATELSHRAAARVEHVVVAPPVAYGSSGEHQDFPGTLSIGHDALALVLVELGRSAQPRPGEATIPLVFVNGHGGNEPAVRAATRQLRDEGRSVSAWAPSVPGGDGHAGRTETSLLLAIAPQVVGSERPAGATAPLSELAADLRTRGVRAVSASGVLGDSAGASAEEGRRLLDALTDALVTHVRGVLDTAAP